MLFITGALYGTRFHRAGLSFAASAEEEQALNGNEDEAKTVLKIASWYAEEDLTYIRAYLEEKFPNYKFVLQYVDKTNYESIIDSQLSYKGAPDIIYMDSGMVKKHAASKYIIPLTDYINGFSKDAWTAFGYGNHIYAIPNTSQYVCMFYNKKLFEEKDVKVPYSYYSFIGACDNFRITKKIVPVAVSLKSPYSLSDSALTYLAGSYLSTDKGSGFGGRLQYGRASFVDETLFYFEDWELLMEHKIFTKEMFAKDSLTALEEFVSGEAAMIIGGPEVYNAIIRRAPDMEIGTLPFYSKYGCRQVIINGCDLGFAVNANSNNLDDAIEVMKSLSTYEGQQALWMDRPGSQTYYVDTDFENSEVYDGIQECIEKGYCYVPWADWGGELCKPVRFQLGKELQYVLLERQSVETALRKVDELVDDILHYY